MDSCAQLRQQPLHQAVDDEARGNNDSHRVNSISSPPHHNRKHPRTSLSAPTTPTHHRSGGTSAPHREDSFQNNAAAEEIPASASSTSTNTSFSLREMAIIGRSASWNDARDTKAQSSRREVYSSPRKTFGLLKSRLDTDHAVVFEDEGTSLSSSTTIDDPPPSSHESLVPPSTPREDREEVVLIRMTPSPNRQTSVASRKRWRFSSLSPHQAQQQQQEEVEDRVVALTPTKTGIESSIQSVLKSPRRLHRGTRSPDNDGLWYDEEAAAIVRHSDPPAVVATTTTTTTPTKAFPSPITSTSTTRNATISEKMQLYLSALKSNLDTERMPKQHVVHLHYSPEPTTTMTTTKRSKVVQFKTNTTKVTEGAQPPLPDDQPLSATFSSSKEEEEESLSTTDDNGESLQHKDSDDACWEVILPKALALLGFILIVVGVVLLVLYTQLPSSSNDDDPHNGAIDNESSTNGNEKVPTFLWVRIALPILALSVFLLKL